MKFCRPFCSIKFLLSQNFLIITIIQSHKKRESVIYLRKCSTNSPKFMKIRFGGGHVYCYSQFISLQLRYFELIMFIVITISECLHKIKGLSHYYITVKAKTAEEVMNNRPAPGVLDPSLAAEYKVIHLSFWTFVVKSCEKHFCKESMNS